jgi:hypothetical protein
MMSVLLSDLLLWLVALCVGLYTLVYARWLLRRKNKRAGWGGGFLSGFRCAVCQFCTFFPALTCLDLMRSFKNAASRENKKAPSAVR